MEELEIKYYSDYGVGWFKYSCDTNKCSIGSLGPSLRENSVHQDRVLSINPIDGYVFVVG